MTSRAALRCVAVAALCLAAGAVPARADDERDSQFFAINAFWTGPYGAAGSALGGAMIDYLKLLNARDGGINGVRLSWEKCETRFETERIVACYERLKHRGRGLALFHPMSTDGAYAVLERARADRIPVLTIGHGRGDGSDGRAFPYLFPVLANSWTQNSAKIRFIASREGGLAGLRGKKIANVHHDSAFGRETRAILEEQARRHDFVVKHFAVAHPGLDQKAIWLRIAHAFKADWAILRGIGVMNPTALKEARQVGFPSERIVGAWCAGAEEDTVPAGAAAEGYIAAGFHGSGTDFPVVRQILEQVYEPGNGELDRARVGSTFYNQGLVWAIVSTEAIRDAMAMVGNRPVSGEEAQRALERFQMAAERIEGLGAAGLIPAFSLSCREHEGMQAVFFRQWRDGRWVSISDWVAGDADLVDGMVKSSAESYARQQGIALRACG